MHENRMDLLLNDGEKEIIRQAGNQVKLHKGGTLFVAGDPADRVYMVDQGWLKIYRVSRDGRQVTVRSFRGPGELMGLAEVLVGGYRSCYAGAVSEMTGCVITRDSYLDLMETEPFLAVKVIKLLAYRMREAERGIHHMVTKRVSHRLAHTLLYMAHTCCGAIGKDIDLEVEVTHEELAAMVGSSRQTVSMILGKFKEKGSIITDQGKIKIVKPHNLVKECHG